MAYADDVNLLGDDIDTIKKNKETLMDASREVSLEEPKRETVSSRECREQTDPLKMWRSSNIWEL
jgi:hypothetical protein